MNNLLLGSYIIICFTLTFIIIRKLYYEKNNLLVGLLISPFIFMTLVILVPITVVTYLFLLLWGENELWN